MANTITNTAVTVGNTSTPIIVRGDVSNTSTRLIIGNDSNEVIYLALSNDSAVVPTAVMNEGLRMPVGGSVDLGGFRGAISGICTSGGKEATVMHD